MKKKFDWTATINFNILVLRLGGLWPPGFENFKRISPYAIYSLFLNLAIIGNNISQTIYVYLILNDLEAVTAVFFALVTEWLQTFKVCCFVKNSQLLKNLVLILECEDFQPNDKQKLLIEPIFNAWKLMYRVFWVTVTSTLFLAFLFPFMDGSFRVGRLPMEAWFPYDSTITPYYELTYLYQVITLAPLAITNLNMDTLIAGLMMYVVAQCEILSDNLKNLKKSGVFADNLIKCINHHKKILRFAENSNSFFDSIVLGQFFASSTSLALGMFRASVVDASSSEAAFLIVYSSCMLVQIFLYCWFGNEVGQKSSQIPYAAFESDWTGVPIGAKKNLLIFIMRAQKPITMSAINLFSLSLSTFTAILRSSWSYFAVLRQVNSQN